LRSLIPILFFSFFFFQSKSQDTISVYFEFGKSKISEQQAMILDGIRSRFDLAEIDSVHYTGMADSVGDVKANLKLSKKRAQETADYCKEFLGKNHHYRTIALGEKSGSSREQNRRVNIVFYMKAITTPTTKEDMTPDSEPMKIQGSCYYVDYELLHRCSRRVIVKNRVEYVRLEVLHYFLKSQKEHYYATVNKSGAVEIKKVKWRNDVTLIPKKDFQQFRIFKSGKEPCEECSEDLEARKGIVYESTCIQVDRFLMKSLQAKTGFFRPRSVKIRALREYVNPGDRYYIGCDMERELIWKTQKGKKKSKYYYASLPIQGWHLENIIRVMECCKSKQEASECNIGMISCGGMSLPDRAVLFLAEAGDYYRLKKHKPYLALGLSNWGRPGVLSFFAGTNSDLDIYASLRYQYHFLNFPFSMLNPASSWQSPGNMWAPDRYGSLYLGTELTTLQSTDAKVGLLEQNLHLGFAVMSSRNRPRIPRIFIQGGIGYDYLKNYSLKPYFVAQAGIQFRLAGGGKGPRCGGPPVDNTRFLQ
jgi:hypothetical protein